MSNRKKNVVAIVAPSSIFKVKVHYGGKFTSYPGRRYVGGFQTPEFTVDFDEFYVHELDTMVQNCGAYDGNPIYYHFLIPGQDLDFGLRALGNDEDVHLLGKFVGLGRTISLYTEHGVTKLDTYFTSPSSSKVVIEDVSEVVKKSIDVGSGMRLLEWKETHVNETKCIDGNQTEGNVEEHTSDGNVEEHTTEGNFGNQTEGNFTEGNVDETMFDELIGNVDENVFDWDYGPDFQVDFDVNINEAPPLNETQASVVQNDVNINEGPVVNETVVNVDDVMVDENNVVEEVEVDMADFHLNVQPEVQKEIGAFVEPTVGDVNIGVLDNDAFDSGYETDDDDPERVRKRMLRELRKQRESENTMYKYSFYVGQDFATATDVKKRIGLHSIETRRELRYVKNDKARVRAVCGGQVSNISSGPTEASGPSGIGPSGTGPSGTGPSGPSVRESCSSGTGPSGTKKTVKESKDKSKKYYGRGNPKELAANECPWTFHVSKLKGLETWRVKTHVSEHKCIQSRNIRACTAEFLSHSVMEQLPTNPKIPIIAIQTQLQRKYELQISKMKAFRAKTKAFNMLRGDYVKQYAMLRDYILELKSCNPGTTVNLDVNFREEDSTRVFKRIYVCLGALKEGFRAGGRDLLGLDGAFMKGPYPGQILTAVGLDGNNGIYPLAYAIVEAETKDSWTWFLENLGDDLDMGRNSNFTFITDRQKGLLPALNDFFPCAEHIYCVRHIHSNMKKKWGGVAYKDQLWKCASASTIPHFEVAMEGMRQLSEDAYGWLSKIPPDGWSRAYMSERAHSDVLLNNMCEVFNRQLVDGRDKPIITCLEYIREYLMRRIVTVQELMKNCSGPLTPNATKILDIMKERATTYKAVWNGDKKFEVSEPWGDQCVVDIEWKHCSCRKWQLRGIPCVHAVATNWKMALGGDRVESIESWVHPVHMLDTWRQMYAFKVQPINGCIMWPKTQIPTTILPPKHHTPVGRPKKNRRKSAGEKASMVKGRNLSGAGKSVTCDKCKKVGHNQRTCKGQVEKTGGKKRKGKEVAGSSGGKGKAPAGKGKAAASSSGAKDKAPARKKRKVTASVRGDSNV